MNSYQWLPMSVHSQKNKLGEKWMSRSLGETVHAMAKLQALAAVCITMIQSTETKLCFIFQCNGLNLGGIHYYIGIFFTNDTMNRIWVVYLWMNVMDWI